MFFFSKEIQTLSKFLKSLYCDLQTRNKYVVDYFYFIEFFFIKK